ncbi:MAG: apolipoprotein N-acyltransferase [Treponema sp.]|jgi:apolipoprotein N-acyltransferase|nr:apolipoprotein N-acyltransferase [Treponema sp.]
MKTFPAHKSAASGGVQSFCVNLGLTALSVLLFVGAFPNLLFEHGFPFCAWIAYVPVVALLYRVNLAASVVWGAVYGYAAYGLFNYWLTAFHPLAGLIVNSIYLAYNAALFFLLRLAITLFPRRAYLAQWLIWLAYEYLRTRGFLGYSYGITGYSQWRMIPLIQIAGIFGVWGVSALVVFPSVWLGAALGSGEESNHGITQSCCTKFFSSLKLQAVRQDSRTPWFRFLEWMMVRLTSFFRTEKVSAFAWLAALVAALCYGLAVPADYSSAPQAHIALIQHNTDPWKGGIDEYRSNYMTLKRLSDEALAAYPRPDMVVWSETAFVPRIYWHETYRDDPSSWLLVKELREYLAAQDIPFVIGNDDARKDPAKNPRADEDYRVDYNAAMFFHQGTNTAVYRKLHLVPFTEHFPYHKQLPWMYRALVNADTHFWEKGTEATVFSGPGFTFSTPICFEDTFGYLSRKFVQNGADLIVNLSNDAWSHSLPAQNQHLSMAVFRAVENGRSMVRSTASGQSCGIGPNGKIIAMAPPFTEAWLTVAVPLVKNDTVYTRRGDYPGIVFTIAACALLLSGGLAGIITARRKS